MDQEELFRRLRVALASGLLIGLERRWQSREAAEGERTAGLRTSALAGLLGGIGVALFATFLTLHEPAIGASPFPIWPP